LNNKKNLYHGGLEAVVIPEIRKSKYTKDFGVGFYCTDLPNQAETWSTKKSHTGYVTQHLYTKKPDLVYKKFTEDDEWLDFVVDCRQGKPHDYDIVEGSMADDKIWNEIDDFVAGDITRAAFWELIKFTKPTHQISFHTEKALQTLKYISEEIVRRAK